MAVATKKDGNSFCNMLFKKFYSQVHKTDTKTDAKTQSKTKTRKGGIQRCIAT